MKYLIPQTYYSTDNFYNNCPRYPFPDQLAYKNLQS